jgi:hypothetical protein
MLQVGVFRADDGKPYEDPDDDAKSVHGSRRSSSARGVDPAKSLRKSQSAAPRISMSSRDNEPQEETLEEVRSGNMQGIFREQSGNSQEIVRKQSGNSQGTVREHSVAIQGTFRDPDNVPRG